LHAALMQRTLMHQMMSAAHAMQSLLICKSSLLWMYILSIDCVLDPTMHKISYFVPIRRFFLGRPTSLNLSKEVRKGQPNSKKFSTMYVCIYSGLHFTNNRCSDAVYDWPSTIRRCHASEEKHLTLCFL
jgi:hypothetical protein